MSEMAARTKCIPGRELSAVLCGVFLVKYSSFSIRVLLVEDRNAAGGSCTKIRRPQIPIMCTTSGNLLPPYAGTTPSIISRHHIGSFAGTV